MSKIVRLKEWPFGQDEKTKLIWIGEPSKENKKWVVKVYFRSITRQETKGIVVDWPTIHFFSMGKVYSNGIINQAEVEEGTFIIDVNLDNTYAQYNERPWDIQGTKETGISRTFNFKKDNKLYIIPSIEIIRGVLGIDSFTLRLMLSMDVMSEYFVYEVEDNVLKIYFSNEYNKNLLSNEKLYHLAWIITNNQVKSMFCQVSSNYRVGENESCKFEFKLNEFSIRARVKIKGTKVFIREILVLKEKRILIGQLLIEHPMLGGMCVTKGIKKREYITYSYTKSEELKVEKDVDGSTKGIEMISSNSIIHSYTVKPAIRKKGIEDEPKRVLSDSTTKQYFHDDKGRRAFGEEGGENIVRGLEFKSLKEIQMDGQCEVFIQVMRLLKEEPKIKNIEVLTNKLNEIKMGRFAFLENGITPRKYILCKIIMEDEKERVVIEIEREKKSLSTLILKSNKKKNWEKVIIRLLYGLIKNTGTWQKYDIEQLSYDEEIEIKRKKHLDNDLKKEVEKMYEFVVE